MCRIEEKAPRSRKGSNLKALFVRGVKANSSPLWLPFVRAILHNVLKPVATCHSKDGSVFGTMAKAFQYSCPVLILIAYLLALMKRGTCSASEAQKIQSLCSRTGLWSLADK